MRQLKCTHEATQLGHRSGSLSPIVQHSVWTVLVLLRLLRYACSPEPSLFIWAATWQNQQNECAPSKDLDQPGHPSSLISVFVVRIKKPWVLSYPLSAQWRLWSNWADAQADLSLRWAHTHFVSFVMSWLICAINAFRHIVTHLLITVVVGDFGISRLTGDLCTFFGRNISGSGRV